MASTAVANFVKQQGFPDVAESSCASQFRALSFQPMAMAPIIVVGIVLQSAIVFLALSAIQWWNALLPRWNLFDAIYNGSVAARPGATRLTPSPAPRRFSMGMAASFMLGIGVSLLAGWSTAAIVLQVFLVIALSAILFGKFCMGSYIYYLLRGEVAFANRTLPWSK